MGRLWRVAAAGSLLGLAAGRPVVQSAIRDELVLLQQLPQRPFADYKPEPGAVERMLKVYNSTKDKSVSEALGGLVEAWYGPDKSKRRVKGLESLTDTEYKVLLSHPWVEQAMQHLRIGTPEGVYEMALALHTLMRKAGGTMTDIVKEIKADEQADRAKWQARFAPGAAPAAAAPAAAAAHAPRGPSVEEIFRGADAFVATAASKRPKLGAFQPLPLSRMMQPSATHAAAPPPPMGVPPQAVWGGFGSAVPQAAAPPQWQQWQQPQPMAPPTWGAYPQQAYQVPYAPYAALPAQPMPAGAQQQVPYAQYAAQPAQPTPAGAQQQGPQSFAFGQPMQGMQGYAPALGPTQQ